MKFRPAGSVPHQGQGRTPQGIPQEVIAELRDRDYLSLVCGHFTSRETQYQFTAFRPKGKRKFFCEKCGSWEEQIVRKIVITPDKPLF